MTLTSPADGGWSDAQFVNALLAMGPRLGMFLSTLDSAERGLAILYLNEALGLPEEVYTALLFRPASVIMCELDEATFTRTFIADPNDGVYVDDKTVFGL